jgi:hypothetical protein
MRRAPVDLRLRFEGIPLPSKLFGGPCVPTLIDQLSPSNIVFVIEIQTRDPRCGQNNSDN